MCFLSKKFASPVLRVYYKRCLHDFLKCPVLNTGKLFVMPCQHLAQQANGGLIKALMNPTTKHRPSGIGSTESIHYLCAFKHKARHEVLSWLCFLCLYKTWLLRPFCLRILFLLQYPSRDEGHSHILKMFLVTDGAAEVFLAALQLTNAWRIYTLPCCWHLWQSFFPILGSKW